MLSFIVYGIILCGFLGSVFDSFLGATIQAKYETQTGEIIESSQEGANFISGISWVNNDMVNLMNTAFAPILMYFYLKLFWYWKVFECLAVQIKSLPENEKAINSIGMKNIIKSLYAQEVQPWWSKI